MEKTTAGLCRIGNCQFHDGPCEKNRSVDEPGIIRDPACCRLCRYRHKRHTVITELAEMGVADHVLESVSGHLSRRMLEHYSHIRIDAKRQALDALDAARRSTTHNGEGNGDGA
ncbi:MAG: hypothetical protein ABW292_07410, partial [Vicinamibacterales bacterium]